MANASVTPARQPPRSREWVTAKVIESRLARRFINRLDSLGYEYNVVAENHYLRILVREQSLNEVLEWFDDLSNSPKRRTKKEVFESRAALSLMIAIPVGLLVGSVFSKLVGIPSPISQTISGFCGFAAAMLAYSCCCRDRENVA